jgi:hypothetical protein
LLTQGARRLTFGVYVAPYAFVFLANSMLSALLQRALGSQNGPMIGGLLGSCVALTMTPFIASIQVRLYVELRMRKEAIDIEWALGVPTAAVGD